MTQRKMPQPDDCIACPIEVRELYASADNAARAIWEALNQGTFDRAIRKLIELEESLKTFKPIIEAHFEDRRHSHRHE